MKDNKYYGVYQGVVTNVNDPEKRGRLKIQCPKVLGGDTESAWCDPVVPVAYDGGGDFCMPQVSEAVWVMFIAGNANKPVWFGGWWQKNMSPLGDNYANLDNVRIISYSNCLIVLQNGLIDININGGESEVQISEGNIKVTGNLTVTGNISATNINANIVTASNLHSH